MSDHDEAVYGFAGQVANGHWSLTCDLEPHLSHKDWRTRGSGVGPGTRHRLSAPEADHAAGADPSRVRAGR